jgi:4-amino-4-deoxy-L-arabinose transferase-like glycosyltransferase
MKTLLFVLSVLLTFVLLRLATSGVLSPVLAGVLLPAASTAMVAAAFFAANEGATARSLLGRHGFWVVTVTTWLLLPRLGSFGLTDPWETHYADVAREMIARRDFISPWWAHDGLFTSKPVLIFWMEAIAMLALGVHVGPDRVLAGGAALAHPEWAVRLPSFVFAVLGAYFIYKGIARTCGRRAGLLSGLAVAASPGYALVAHQAITDMPLVGAMSAAMGLLMIALSARDNEQAPVVRLGSGMALHAGRVVALVFLALLLPQLVYLVTRHLHVDATGLHLVKDSFFLGSPENCTLPGQLPCTRGMAANPRLAPVVNALVWLPVLFLVVSQTWNETRLSRVAAYAAFIFAALATMAKGPAGIAIPFGALCVYVIATRAWKQSVRLPWLTGAAMICALTLPWYVAVYSRHGKPFTDELVFRHMLGRTLSHLHDTNDGEDTGMRYYVWQLGYALFPWAGLALSGLLSALRGGSGARARTTVFLAAWALVSFGLVSAMHTKFHHYMLPAVPPLAALAGLFVDDLLPRAAQPEASATEARVLGPRVLALVGSLLVTLLIARDLMADTGGRDVSGQAHLVQLFTYRYDRAWPAGLHFTAVFGAFAVALALMLAGMIVARVRRLAATGFVVAALGFSAFAVDVYLPACADHWGQRPLLDAFYEARGPKGPELVAYQMNWKGENFYTGNRVAIFVTSGAPMKAYVEQRRARGQGDLYFVTEHERVNGLRSELGAVKSFERLTTPDQDRQFCLVRAVL